MAESRTGKRWQALALLSTSEVAQLPFALSDIPPRVATSKLRTAQRYVALNSAYLPQRGLGLGTKEKPYADLELAIDGAGASPLF
eukprot:5483295-Alexandrium_andersonii.AAC.1